MGWIFFRQRYERMGLIDQDDLEEDAGMSENTVTSPQTLTSGQLCVSSTNTTVRYAFYTHICASNHAFPVPIALFSAFVIPAVIGSIWHDAVGALIWGGLVGRITGELSF